MPFDQQTLDAVREAGKEGGLIVRVTFGEPAFAAYWQRQEGASAIAHGDTEGDALDNLLLVLTGKGEQVVRAVRLKVAASREAEALAAYEAARAERERIEGERVSAARARR